MKSLQTLALRVFVLLVLSWSVMIARVDGKSSLILHCPPNKYVSCTDDLYNLSRFGNATYTVGYMTFSAGMPVVTYHLNSCHVGYIKRTWSVEDSYWNWHTCSQYIYVSSTQHNPLQITWPPDYEVEGCNPNVKPHQLPPPYNSPTWSGDECRMIGKSYTDMVFTVNNGCKKIMRTWKLIDWCDNNGFGTQWTHQQIIKIVNEERPHVDCPKDITVNAFNCKNAVVNVPALVVGATSCGGSAIISNNSPYSTEKGANISGVYPIGTTKIIYTIQYGCGSRIFCHVNVVVKNAATPTPYCLHGITTTLMPIDTNGDGTPENGMVDIWAKDLDRGSKSLCNYYPLRFSFSPDPTDMFKTFTCDDLGQNGVMIFVTDSKGGQSACMVNVVIQNNSSNIPDCHRKVDSIVTQVPFSLHGKIESRFGKPLENASINISYDEPKITVNTKIDTVEFLKKDSFINASGYLLYFFSKEKKITTTTDTVKEYIILTEKSNSAGNFNFKEISLLEKACSFSAQYKDEQREGIDGKDVEYLTKFLLGEVQFENAYQWIAADMNEDKKIDITDLNVLLKFVTNDLQELPGKKWHFVNKNIALPNQASVLETSFDHFLKLEALKDWKDSLMVMGIKKGNITNADNLVNHGFETTDRSAASEDIRNIIYPNPSTGALFLKVDTAVEFTLSSVNGEKIYNGVISEKGTHQINHSNFEILPPGVYIFQINNGIKNTIGKWMKL